MTEEEFIPVLRDHWRKTIEDVGGYCPCCERWGKIYKRPLNSTMARSLMWLVNTPHRGDGWTHVPDVAPTWLLRAPQLTSLSYWGLVVPFSKESKLLSSGLWKPTNNGIRFAHNELRVPKYVFLYNNRVLETTGEDVSIVECLGDKYDYNAITENYNGTDSLQERIAQNIREEDYDYDSRG